MKFLSNTPLDVLSGSALDQAIEIVAHRLGLDFSGHRRADLRRRLSQVLRRLPEYASEERLSTLLKAPAHSPEFSLLTQHLTVGETYFFRDAACFHALEKHILPALLKARREAGSLTLSLWSAASSSGEEAYSLAMLLDQLLPDRQEWSISLLATDIDETALEKAKAGLYTEWSFRNTPAEVRQRYFRSHPSGKLELAPKIREMVRFTPLNLAAPVYPSANTGTVALDLILCRNVLMYFTGEAREAVIQRLHAALRPGGWLITAPPEASSALLQPLVATPFPDFIAFRKLDETPSPKVQPRWRSRVPLQSPAPEKCRPQPRVPTVNAARNLSATPPADPSTGSSALLLSVQQLADSGDLQSARSRCEQVVNRDRLNGPAYLLLAAICRELGDENAARQALQQAIYLDPHCPMAYFSLGALYLSEQQTRRGQQLMQVVVELLRARPDDELVPGSDGLTVRGLRETAQTFLLAG